MSGLLQQWFVRHTPRSMRWLGCLVVALVVAIGLHSAAVPAAGSTLPPSQYSSTITAPFNQPGYFPAAQTPPSNLYRPNAEWVGRLILPSAEQYRNHTRATQETDWAWFQVYAAPLSSSNLVGQTVRLAWAKEPFVEQYVRVASRDVRFTERAHENFQNGTVNNPIRLDGRDRVGPLQSVAGSLPDDVTVVQLWGKVTIDAGKKADVSQPDLRVVEQVGDQKKTLTALPVTLQVEREPLQDTGRFTALVKFVAPVPPQSPATLPPKCPGEQPCTSDLMRVRHYNLQTRKFDGLEEVIRIPQQPPDVGGVFSMTTRELVKSPAGEAGWYVSGAKANDGRFTVEAMKPRLLFMLPPQEVVLGFNNGLRYINTLNWQDLEQRKGTLQTVLVNSEAKTAAAAEADWKVGDRAFFIHLYGGRGGTHERSESFIIGTYAGHFSFGVATVITDPFTQEPIFDLNYFQVFGNGNDGTLSGGQTWTHYMGDMRRGFMGTRPVSDVLVKLDTLTGDYDFGGTKLSFFNELIAQLSLVGARYRIGDGTGNSTITSATSCVQDSAQAVFHTLMRFRQKVESNPEIVQWMKANPDDPNTLRFKKLVQLAKDLNRLLTPMGVVRWDWEKNSEVLIGVESQQKFLSIDNFQPRNLATGLISWRTAMPRQAHDEFATIFLHNGAALWFMRPNIVGGNDPGLAPLEPTLLLGAWRLPFTQTPLPAYLVIRTFGGVTIPSLWQWLTTLGILLGFGAIALAFGYSQGILHWYPWQAPWYRRLGLLLKLLFVPALVQEYVFRVLMIPYPKDWVPAGYWWAWAMLALGLFVGFHWLYARYIKQSPSALGTTPGWLTLVTILGLACTFTYRLTGSLWTITIVHWVFVSVWRLLLGGQQQRLRSQDKQSAMLKKSELYGERRKTEG